MKGTLRYGILVVLALVMVIGVAMAPKAGDTATSSYGDSLIKTRYGITAKVSEINTLANTNLSATTLGYINTLTSNAQTQLTALLTGKINNTTGIITSALINDATITGADIASNTVATGNILNATILGEDIATNTVASSNLLNATILGEDIASNTVTSDNILNSSLTKADTNHYTIYLNTASGTGVQNMNVYNASATVDIANITIGAHDMVLGTLNSVGTDGFGNFYITINSPGVGNYLYIDAWM